MCVLFIINDGLRKHVECIAKIDGIGVYRFGSKKMKADSF